MKKLVVLVVVVMFFITACSNSEKDITKSIHIEPNDTTEAGVYAGNLQRGERNTSKKIVEEMTETEAETRSHLDDEHMDAIYEKLFKRFYTERITDDPYELAGFLILVDALDDVMPVLTKKRSLNAAVAVEVFHEDEKTHQKALEKAKELINAGHFDCDDWGKLLKTKCKELTSDDFETYEEYEAYMELNYPSLATSAETGEPISSKPGSPVVWAN